MEDALNPRLAGSTEGMTLQVLAQIRDSLSAHSRDFRSVTEGIADVRDRVIRLEERDKRLTDVEADVKSMDLKVDALLKDKDRRDGATSFISRVPAWLSFLIALGSVFSALYLAGRAAGIVPAPPARVEATIQPDDRTIAGKVGGRP